MIKKGLFLEAMGDMINSISEYCVANIGRAHAKTPFPVCTFYDRINYLVHEINKIQQESAVIPNFIMKYHSNRMIKGTFHSNM